MVCLENVLKISLQVFLKTFWRRLEDVLKTSWRRLEDVLKIYGQDEYIGIDQDVLKTSSEDVRLRRTYSSWPRRLEDVFWRRRRKTSSRRLHEDECLLVYFLFINNPIKSIWSLINLINFFNKFLYHNCLI